MAPAVMGLGIPSAPPTPMRAIPTVPAVVQDVPVETATIEQISKVAARKYLGDSNFNP